MCICPRWHTIPYDVHYGPWSKVVYYNGNRVPFAMQPGSSWYSVGHVKAMATNGHAKPANLTHFEQLFNELEQVDDGGAKVF